MSNTTLKEVCKQVWGMNKKAFNPIEGTVADYETRGVPENERPSTTNIRVNAAPKTPIIQASPKLKQMVKSISRGVIEALTPKPGVEQPNYAGIGTNPTDPSSPDAKSPVVDSSALAQAKNVDKDLAQLATPEAQERQRKYIETYKKDLKSLPQNAWAVVGRTGINIATTPSYVLGSLIAAPGYFSKYYYDKVSAPLLDSMDKADTWIKDKIAPIHPDTSNFGKTLVSGTAWAGDIVLSGGLAKKLGMLAQARQGTKLTNAQRAARLGQRALGHWPDLLSIPTAVINAEADIMHHPGIKSLPGTLPRLSPFERWRKDAEQARAKLDILKYTMDAPQEAIDEARRKYEEIMSKEYINSKYLAPIIQKIKDNTGYEYPSSSLPDYVEILPGKQLPNIPTYWES